MSANKCREQFESKYPAPLGVYWNSMVGEYQQSWPEHDGDFDKEIAIHNDRYRVWCESREAVTVVLPQAFEAYGVQGHHAGDGDAAYLDFEVIEAIENQGLKYSR